MITSPFETQLSSVGETDRQSAKTLNITHFPDISVICPSVCFRLTVFGNYEFQKVLRATQCSRPLQTQWPPSWFVSVGFNTY